MDYYEAVLHSMATGSLMWSRSTDAELIGYLDQWEAYVYLECSDELEAKALKAKDWAVMS